MKYDRSIEDIENEMEEIAKKLSKEDIENELKSLKRRRAILLFVNVLFNLICIILAIIFVVS